jgi:hypothetical protein
MTCPVPGCTRKPAPGWARCEAHVRALIEGAFGPDRQQGGERHAGVVPPVDPPAVLLAVPA